MANPIAIAAALAGLVKCPHCGKATKRHTKVCSHCKKALPTGK